MLRQVQEFTNSEGLADTQFGRACRRICAVDGLTGKAAAITSRPVCRWPQISPDLRLLEVAGFCQSQHDIEIFHTLRLAGANDFIFLDLAFRCDI
jgi:hypothetical protein